jgi:hypothetical protein
MFEILEHPADIGFRVRGASLTELFGNAAIAISPYRNAAYLVYQLRPTKPPMNVADTYSSCLGEVLK